TGLQRHVGLRRLWQLPFWKKEGYSEMVAFDDSLTVDEIRRLLRTSGAAVSRQPGLTVPRPYWEAEAAWSYLVRARRQSIDNVLATTEPLQAILRQITDSAS